MTTECLKCQKIIWIIFFYWTVGRSAIAQV